MKTIQRIRLLTITALLTLPFPACESKRYFRANYNQVNALLHAGAATAQKPYLKAHMKNGDVYIFSQSWQFDSTHSTLSGQGQHYNALRSKIADGALFVSADSVALFETNQKLSGSENGRIAALSILAGLNAALGIYCVTIPKACFGSCPTFYMQEETPLRQADAEGYSNAILPSMQYADVDALNNPEIGKRQFSLYMKNEALETHCTDAVSLLAYPRKAGERVYHSPADQFYLCDRQYPLKSAAAPEGNISHLLSKDDGQERFSLSDPSNLRSKEEILLEFDQVDAKDHPGLLIHFRQTLMTTYLFYSAMGYMGDEVGDVFAYLENDAGMKSRFDASTRELGGIDLYVWNELAGTWEFQHSITETGPIAVNKQFIPVKNRNSGGKIKLKLCLNKGLWRLDHLALARIKEKVEPVKIRPERVFNKGVSDVKALRALQEPGNHLIAMPGSSYELCFTLPSDDDYELFLKSEGYYLEWMRDHWLKDKDLNKLRQMVYAPRRYLKSEAAAYKRYEAEMESVFWNSRLDTKTFTYENH